VVRIVGLVPAIAFGADLSRGYWITVATIVALKPSREQTTLIAVQRLAGALIGAAAAVLLLVPPLSTDSSCSRSRTDLKLSRSSCSCTGRRFACGTTQFTAGQRGSVAAEASELLPLHGLAELAQEGVTVLGVHYADPDVHRARAVGAGDDGVQVQLGDLGQVVG
jgi:hypothetical protein